MKEKKSISLDIEVIKKIDEVAKYHGITFSSMINMILMNYLRNLKSKKVKK